MTPCTSAGVSAHSRTCRLFSNAHTPSAPKRESVCFSTHPGERGELRRVPKPDHVVPRHPEQRAAEQVPRYLGEHERKDEYGPGVQLGGPFACFKQVSLLEEDGLGLLGEGRGEDEGHERGCGISGSSEHLT